MASWFTIFKFKFTFILKDKKYIQDQENKPNGRQANPYPEIIMKQQTQEIKAVTTGSQATWRPNRRTPHPDNLCSLPKSLQVNIRCE